MLLNPPGRCFQGLSGTESQMTLSEFEALDTCYSDSATPAPTTAAPTTPAPTTPAPTTPAPTTPASTTPALTIQVFQGSLPFKSGVPVEEISSFLGSYFPALSVKIAEVIPSGNLTQTICFALQPLDSNTTFEVVMGTLSVSWLIPHLFTAVRNRETYERINACDSARTCQI